MEPETISLHPDGFHRRNAKKPKKGPLGFVRLVDQDEPRSMPAYTTGWSPPTSQASLHFGSPSRRISGQHKSRSLPEHQSDLPFPQAERVQPPVWPPLGSGRSYGRYSPRLSIGASKTPSRFTRPVANSQHVDRPHTPHRRRMFPKEAFDVLEAWLQRHSDYPYPNEEARRQLCHATGLSKIQVSNWMTYARRRIRASTVHRAPPPRACAECRRLGLQCEPGVVPCRNCTERGCSELCPHYIALDSAVLVDFSTSSDVSETSSDPRLEEDHGSNHNGNPPVVTRSSIPDVLFNLTGRLTKYTVDLSALLPCLWLPFFLGLPLYYSAQASAVLDHAEKCKLDYEQWTNALDTTMAKDSSTNEENGIELRSMESSSQRQPFTSPPDMIDRQLTTVTKIQDSSPLQPTESSPSLLVSCPPPMPDSVLKLQDAWVEYIDERAVEWKLLFTAACVFVAASPAIFQIPGTNDDPVVRSFAFLGVYRAFAGVLFGQVFPLHFRRSYTRDVRYATAWAQAAKKSRVQRLGNMWVMLSLPAAVTAWALLFFGFAILTLIWRSGSGLSTSPSPYPGPSPNTSSSSGPPAAVVTRSLVTGVMLVDVACGVWVWWRLKCLAGIVLRKGTDGGSHQEQEQALSSSHRPHNGSVGPFPFAT